MTKAEKIRAYIDAVYLEKVHHFDGLGFEHKVLTYDNARQHGIYLRREYDEKWCEGDYVCRIARSLGWKIRRLPSSIVLYHDGEN